MAKRALLVGIDIYPDPQNNLNSCVADTLAFKTLLQETYSFDPASIQLLHNQNASLANVHSGLDALFEQASPEDQIVYFESSHGYRYPEGDTMVEVLCLYDGFLTDTELAERTQVLPPGVLTVVLDACHTGGMNKVFFPAGQVQVARAKVWQPTAADAARHAQSYAQVTKFKFFGRAATGNSGAVAKNFMVRPAGMPSPKDLGQGAVELNGALFAACQADQTAAAGSPSTNNLSAFTYGILQEIDTSVSLSGLNDRVGARLARLNMVQTPIAMAPLAYPGQLSETFIEMQPASGAASPPPGPWDPFTWLWNQPLIVT